VSVSTNVVSAHLQRSHSRAELAAADAGTFELLCWIALAGAP
jgi:hypothetical protein